MSAFILIFDVIFVRQNCRPEWRVEWRGSTLVTAYPVPDLILYVHSCNDLSLRKCEVYPIMSCYRHSVQWWFNIDNLKAITSNLKTLKVGLKTSVKFFAWTIRSNRQKIERTRSVKVWRYACVVQSCTYCVKLTKCSAIAERPRCRVRYSFGQKWKTGVTIFYGHYSSIFNHCDIIGLKIYEIRWKKRQITAITAFKVIQGHRGRYQSKARMRLPIRD